MMNDAVCQSLLQAFKLATALSYSPTIQFHVFSYFLNLLHRWEINNLKGATTRLKMATLFEDSDFAERLDCACQVLLV